MKKFQKFVMIVEDEEAVAQETLKMIESFLEYNRYGVIIAKNGLEAFQQIKKYRSWFGLKQNKIKCILLDLRMPEMDGVEFVTKLRKMETRNIFAQYMPIVFVTAWEDQEKWESALDSFVATYLKKPFTEDQIRNILRKILQNRDAEVMAEFTRKKAIQKLTDLEMEKN